MSTITINFTNGQQDIEVGWNIFSSNCINPVQYILTLRRDGNSIGTEVFDDTNNTGSWYFSNVGLGVFQAQFTVLSQDPFDPSAPLQPCDSVFSNTIVNAVQDCIPLGTTNLSFSLLSDFYNLPQSNVLLSGPNNPSTGDSIFGRSSLPATGAISRTRPNAVSELRGDCRLSNLPVFVYEVGFRINRPSSFIDTSGNIYQGIYELNIYDLTWFSRYFGNTTSCPQTSYTLKIRLTLQHVNISGAVVFGTPYIARLFRNNSQIGGVSKAATNGVATDLITVTLNQNDTLYLLTDTQTLPFSTNCGRTMQYFVSAVIEEVLLNGNAVYASGDVNEARDLSSSPCPSTTQVFYELQENDIFQGAVQLYVNNVLVDTINTPERRSRFVSGSNVPVRIRTIYNGAQILGSFNNPRIQNNTKLNNNTNVITSQAITQGVLSFLDSTVNTPSSGTNTIRMVGSLLADFTSINCGTTIRSNTFNTLYSTLYQVTLGSTTGRVDLTAGPSTQFEPIRFQVIYNGNVVIDSGYISADPNANSVYLTRLNNVLTSLGEPTVASITTMGTFRGNFTKSLASPTTATVRVLCPLGGGFAFTLSCVR